MTSESLSTRPFGDSGDGGATDLLELYLAGKLAGAEAERVERWMAANADGRAVVEVFRDGVTCVDTEIPAAHLMVERLRSSRNSGATHERSAFATVPAWGAHDGRWWVWSVAAAAFSIVVILFAWSAGVRHVSQRVAMSSLVYTTGNGERANIALPDGGTVALNVASRLEVPMDYATGNHTVQLVGQGLFTVPHRGWSPFVVVAGGTATRVLGTTFSVRRYATDSVVTVAVREGRVAVGAAVVTAHRLVQVGRRGTSALQDASAGAFSFATGTLALSYMSLVDAIPELDRWYDVDIRLGSPALAERHIKGEFAAGSLSDLTSILELTFDVRTVRDGRVLTLYPGSSK